MARRCAYCGTSNPDDFNYCMKCGQSLTQSPEAIAMAERIKGHDYERLQTDRKVSPSWTLVLLLIVVPGALIRVWYLFWYWHEWTFHTFDFPAEDLIDNLVAYVSPALDVVFGIMGGMLVVRLASRLNDHASRENHLMRDFLAYIRVAATPEQRSALTEELMIASEAYGRTGIFQTRSDPKKWGIWVAVLFVLSGATYFIVYGLQRFLPLFSGYSYFAFNGIWSNVLSMVTSLTTIVLIFVAIHLMRTLHEHELRWRQFVQTSHVLLRGLGRQVPAERVPVVHKERSVVFYALLSVVTFGLFGLYWLYTLIDDPNKHFDDHRATEGALFAAIRGS